MASDSNLSAVVIQSVKRLYAQVLRGAFKSALKTLAAAVFAYLCANYQFLFSHPKLYLSAAIPLSVYIIWTAIVLLTRTRVVPFSECDSSAIRGALWFLPGQEKLFAKLGRESKIGDFLGKMLDEHATRILLVAGPAHTGKTSIVHGGFRPELKKHGILLLYFRAGESNELASFRDLVEKANHYADAGAPGKVTKADNESGTADVSESGELTQQQPAKAIVIVDQFELMQEGTDLFQAFIDFAKKVLQQPYPSHLQLAVILRDTHLENWKRLQGSGIREDRRVSVDYLSIRAAKKSAEKILGTACIQIHRWILRDFFKTIATQTGVCPQDIGIFTKVLDHRVQTSGRRYLGIFDYISRGGAFGILVEYVEQWFHDGGLKIPAERASFLNELLLRRDAEGYVRPTAVHIGNQLRLDAQHESTLKKFIPTLATDDWGILEAAPIPASASATYRFCNNRFIPILEHISQPAPPQLDGASIRNIVMYYFGRWCEGNKNPKFLLKHALLKQALRYRAETQNNALLAEYFDRSRTARGRRWWGWAISGIAVAVAVWYITISWSAAVQHKRLTQWRLAPELYDRQRQLEVLRIHNSLMTDLRWLTSSTLQELKIDGAPPLVSLEGIENVRNLNYLVLDLSGSHVNTLRPLSALPKLCNLDLSLGGESGVNNVADLVNLPGLQSLKLQIRDSVITNLSILKKLSNLTSLTIELNQSQLPVIANLVPVTNLQNLTLVISGINNDSSTTSPQPTLETVQKEFSQLEKLSQLTSLKLKLNESDIKRLPDITGLQNLRTLSLDFTGSHIKNISSISALPHLQHLFINADGSEIDTLPDFQSLGELEDLDLRIGKSHIIGLPALPPHFALLHLDARASELLKEPIKKLLQMKEDGQEMENDPLHHVTDLEVDLHTFNPTELKALAKLTNMRKLSLRLNWSQIGDLPDFISLSHLDTLALYIDGLRPDRAAELTQFHNIHTLTVNVGTSQSDTLPDLGGFADVVTLNLNLETSQIAQLPDLRKYTSLKMLSVNLKATTKIESLDELKPLLALKKVRILELDLERSSIKNLPALSEIDGLHTWINLQNSTIRNLTSINTFGATGITLDDRILSLAKLPSAVRILNICSNCPGSLSRRDFIRIAGMFPQDEPCAVP